MSQEQQLPKFSYTLSPNTDDELVKIYQVNIDGKDMLAMYEGSLKNYARQNVNIKGFRKNKEPMWVIKKNITPKILAEIEEYLKHKMFSEIGQDISKKEKLEPMTNPMFNKNDQSLDSGENITLEIKIVQRTTIPDIDLKDLSLNKVEANISKEDIQENENNFVKANQVYIERDEGKTSENNDRVTIDLKIFMGEVEYKPGAQNNIPFILTDKDASKDSIEKELFNKAKGDLFDYSPPKDKKEEEESANKESTETPAKEQEKDIFFKVTVKSVAYPKYIPPQLTKEFCEEKKLELKEATEQLQKSLDSRSKQLVDYKEKVDLLSLLYTNYPFKVPNLFIEQEKSYIEKFLKSQNNTKFTDDQISEFVNRRVHSSILVGELAAKHKITVSDEDLNNSIRNEIISAPPHQQQQMLQHYQDNTAAFEKHRNALIEDKLILFILETIKNTETQTIPLKELQTIMENDIKYLAVS